jgi:hypothetical protein
MAQDNGNLSGSDDSGEGESGDSSGKDDNKVKDQIIQEI